MYDLAASDLHPLHPQNLLVKYADDTYFFIAASSSNLADQEIDHINGWAKANNLQLNFKKCAEIIFRPKSKSRIFNTAFLIDNVPLLNSGIPRLSEIKVLGVTLTDTLSFAPHLKNIITKASPSLFALKTLKSHGLQGANLHYVCTAYLYNQLTYAIPSWRGFANSEDLARLQKVLNRATRWGLHGGTTLSSLLALADKSDKALFKKLVNDPAHPMHALLPPERSLSVSLRQRTHNFQLSVETTLSRKNFIPRMLFNDIY